MKVHNIDLFRYNGKLVVLHYNNKCKIALMITLTLTTNDVGIVIRVWKN